MGNYYIKCYISVSHILLDTYADINYGGVWLCTLSALSFRIIGN